MIKAMFWPETTSTWYTPARMHWFLISSGKTPRDPIVMQRRIKAFFHKVSDQTRIARNADGKPKRAESSHAGIASVLNRVMDSGDQTRSCAYARYPAQYVRSSKDLRAVGPRVR